MNSRSGRIFFLLWMLTGSLAGCGLKGDLYLPDNQAPAATAAEDDDENKEGSRQPGATDSTTPGSAP